MSNSRDDASAIDFLDENEQPSPELLATHRQLIADGAAWRRTLPSADPLLQWVVRGDLGQQAAAGAGDWVDTSYDTPRANSPRWQAPATLGRLQGLAAGSVALVVVLLFGLLIHAITGSHPATSVSTPTTGATAGATVSATVSATEVHTAKWAALGNLTLTGAVSITGQTGAVAVAPSNPQVVYEAVQSPASVRRTRNNGASWQKLTLPVDPANVTTLEIFVSPLDANNVFLTITGLKPVGDTSPCSNTVAYTKQHGGILASGQASCSTTYRSTDGGARWKALRLPVPGAISNGGVTFFANATNPLQAQGKTLYSLVNCGPNCSGDPGFMLKSTDNGTTWKITGPPGGACLFKALPGHSTIFASTASGPCGIYEGGASAAFLERSDDGGRTWKQIGRPPNNGLVDLAAAYLAGTETPVLYVESPVVTTQGHSTSFNIDATSFYASSDDGAHWVQAPQNSGSIPQSNTRPLQIGTEPDGSIVLSFLDATRGDQATTMTLYGWKPGQQVWHAASAPLQGAAQLLLNIGSTYWTVLDTSDASSTTTRIYRYAP
jgi:hypothetical protein